jgi:hypothetical protein
MNPMYGRDWLMHGGRPGNPDNAPRLKLAGLHEVDYQLLDMRFRGLVLPGRAHQGVRNARLSSG